MIIQGHKDIVELLLKYKADAGIEDMDSKTPLLLANSNGNVSRIENTQIVLFEKVVYFFAFFRNWLIQFYIQHLLGNYDIVQLLWKSNPIQLFAALTTGKISINKVFTTYKSFKRNNLIQR